MRLEFLREVWMDTETSLSDGDVVLDKEVVDSLRTAVMDLAEASIT